jgi:hypothetical protein
VSAGLFHEPVHHAQSEAGAGANRLAREERLEDVRDVFGRNANRSMPIPPLIVAVSLSETELLAAWRRELISSIAVFAGR